MTSAAASALLKTLEDPPGHVIFVLATTDPQKVLPTIRSRTQHFEFRLLGRRRAGLAASRRQRPGRPRTSRPKPSTWWYAGATARPGMPCRPSIRWRPPATSTTTATVVTDIVDALADRDPGRVLLEVAEAMSAGRDPRRLGHGAARAAAQRLPGHPGPRPGAARRRRGWPTWRRRPAGSAPPALVRAMEVIGQALIDMRDAPDPRITLEVALVRLAVPDADDSRRGSAGAHRAPGTARGRASSSRVTWASLRSGPLHRPSGSEPRRPDGAHRLSPPPADSCPGRPPTGPRRPTGQLPPHRRLTSCPARPRLPSIRASRRRPTSLRRPTRGRPSRRRATGPAQPPPAQQGPGHESPPAYQGPAQPPPAQQVAAHQASTASATAGPARLRRPGWPVAEPGGADHRLGRHHPARAAPGGEGLPVRRAGSSGVDDAAATSPYPTRGCWPGPKPTGPRSRRPWRPISGGRCPPAGAGRRPGRSPQPAAPARAAPRLTLTRRSTSTTWIDAPAAVLSPEQRLLEAFPGAEEVSP